MINGVVSALPPPKTSRHLPPMPMIWPLAMLHFWLALPLQVTMMTGAPSVGALPWTSRQLPKLELIWPLFIVHT